MTIAAIQKTIESVTPTVVKGVGTVLSAVVLFSNVLGLSMKDKVIASTLLGAATWLLSEEIERSTAKRVYQEALKIFETGDLNKAQIMAETALAYPEAHTLMGRIYLKQGQLEKGDEALHKAVGLGSSDALYRLGWRWEEAKKPHTAFALYMKAARLGHKEAAFAVALYYSRGFGVTQDNEEALYWFKEAARFGHKAADYYLYLAHLHGIGTVPSQAVAEIHLEKAFQADDIRAIFIKAEKEKSLPLYKKAAEMGHAEAGFIYGSTLYQTDQQAGLSALLNAAKLGSAKAALWCGAILEIHDPVLGNHWYHVARERVQQNKDKLYEFGLFLEKQERPDRALPFFEAAADLGCPHALYKVGFAFLQTGGPEAILRLQEAAKLGSEEANKWLASNPY